MITTKDASKCLGSDIFQHILYELKTFFLNIEYSSKWMHSLCFFLKCSEQRGNLKPN